MSTHSILSRFHTNINYIILSLLGSLLVSLQLVLPATAFAASPRATSDYTFGKTQSMDLASVAVVRLVVDYSSINASSTPASISASGLTPTPTTTTPSGNGGIPTCSRNGLGTIVSSAGSNGNYLNYVLADSSVVDPSSITCSLNVPKNTKPITSVISGIRMYASSAYAGSKLFPFPLISCSNSLSGSGMVGCTSQSSSNSPVQFICQPLATAACGSGAILLSFISKDPQPYLSVSSVGADNTSFGIELNEPGLASFTPPAPVSTGTEQVAQQYTQPFQIAHAATTGIATNFDAGMPIVNGDGKNVVGMEPAFSNRASSSNANLISFVTTNIPKTTNTLQTDWAAGIGAYYGKGVNHYATAQSKFAAAAALNKDFMGAATFESIAKGKVPPPPPQSFNFNIILAIAALIIILLVFFVVTLIVGRRRREMARFERERESADRTATLGAERIRMEETARRISGPMAAQPGQPVQAALPVQQGQPPYGVPVPGQEMSPSFQPVLTELRCPNCHSPYTMGDIYCQHCRTLLTPLDAEHNVHMVQPQSAPPPQPYPPVPNIQSPVLMPSSSIDEMPTQKFSPSQQSLAEETTVPAFRKAPTFNGHNVSIAAGSRSDPGIKRKLKPNEDSLLAIMGERTHNSLPQQFGLFVVADGMGGHANGQDASRLAIQTMVDRILPKLSSSEELDDTAFVQLLVHGVQQANMAVYERNMEHHADMGTTMTSAIVMGGMAYVANVGDSRTYMYREPEGLHKITHDHSVVASLVEAGIIRNEDIYTHPKRNQIYRSLGEKPDLEVDSFVEALQPGDKLLLCSDGLWEMVRDRDAQRDQDIQRILSVPNADPKQTVNALINAANHGGGEDNISAIVVSVTEATKRTGMTGIHVFDMPESVKLPQM